MNHSLIIKKVAVQHETVGQAIAELFGHVLERLVLPHQAR
jgi:hypothetical protein